MPFTCHTNLHRNHAAGRQRGMRATATFIVTLFLLYSCYSPRYAYSPPAVNVPLLTKKGDSKFGALYSNNFPGKEKNATVSRPYSYGLDIHTAYALSNKWAVQLNYFLRSEKNGDNQGTVNTAAIKYRRELLEAGVGTYRRINGSDKKIFQLTAGAGLGKFSFTDRGRDSMLVPYQKYHRSDVWKLFVQPACMFISKKRTAISVASRFSILYYSNIQTDYSEQQLTNYELFTLGGDPVIFWEPAFVHTIGLKRLPDIRFEYQFGFSALLSRRFIDARTFNVSAGLQADIAGLLSRKVATKRTEPLP